MATDAMALGFFVEPNGWPDTPRRDNAVNALTAVTGVFNAYGDFNLNNSGSIYAYYNSGIPTAQANYNGSIGYGGTYPNFRVTLHEASHWLGPAPTARTGKAAPPPRSWSSSTASVPA